MNYKNSARGSDNLYSTTERIKILHKQVINQDKEED
jgi:hypothetical protein